MKITSTFWSPDFFMCKEIRKETAKMIFESISINAPIYVSEDSKIKTGEVIDKIISKDNVISITIEFFGDNLKISTKFIDGEYYLG